MNADANRLSINSVNQLNPSNKLDARERNIVASPNPSNEICSQLEGMRKFNPIFNYSFLFFLFFSFFFYFFFFLERITRTLDLTSIVKCSKKECIEDILRELYSDFIT